MGHTGPVSPSPATPGLATPFDAEAGWMAPSPRLVVVRRAEVAAVAVVTLVVASAACTAAFGLLGGAIAAAGVVVLGVLGQIFVGRRVRSWGYLERGEDLLVRRGVAFRRLTVVPYGRMQLVDVNAGPVERSFGLATVRLHTAAAASDARIPGLEGPEARRLRDRLASVGEAQAQGL